MRLKTRIHCAFQPYHVGPWRTGGGLTIGYTTRRRAKQAGATTGHDVAKLTLRSRLGHAYYPGDITFIKP